MLTQDLTLLFKRDLDLLKKEIEAYKNEAELWKTVQGINNSAGNLALHLIGNLNHFIGTTLGNTGYIRNREEEFSLKNIPREKIIADILQTKEMIEKVLAQVNPESLAADYPLEVLNQKLKTGFFLIHLSTHLTYHLGQVNYHRRLLAES